jgi:ABC-type transport system involved in multi-copper enzyme maturation permease subunit
MISDALTLFRTDLLKLRRRRGLIALAGLLAIGGVSVIFTVNAIRHGSTPLQAGPAGGIKNFENSTDFLAMMGVVVAAILGATAGAGDAETGVLRDLVATGRSRTQLFLSRAAAGAATAMVVMLAALAVASILSVALAGSLQSPSFSYILQRDASVLALVAVSALSAVGIATFARSRGPVMAVVIAFGVIVSQLLMQISFLGGVRAALPLAAFQHLAGDTRGVVAMSTGAAITVLVAWGVAFTGVGNWWARRMEI